MKINIKWENIHVLVKKHNSYNGHQFISAFWKAGQWFFVRLNSSFLGFINVSYEGILL